MGDIQYIQHDDIDQQKWDACIERSPQGLVYAYAWYLNSMSPNWNALVMGDYDAVMPLTGRFKWGIHYLYQPAFCAELGVFAKGETDSDLVRSFLSHIPTKYKYLDICLNRHNTTVGPEPSFILRKNYILSLSSDYSVLYSQYADNHKRNIKKAHSNNLIFKADVNVNAAIQLIRSTEKNAHSYADHEWEMFETLYQHAVANKSAICNGVLNNEGDLLSAAIFFYAHSIWFYIVAGTSKEGKAFGASHFLVDSFIQLHAGEKAQLDFEGSDAESVAFFYKGFGAINRPYPRMHVNRLPAWIRWIKK